MQRPADAATRASASPGSSAPLRTAPLRRISKTTVPTTPWPSARSEIDCFEIISDQVISENLLQVFVFPVGQDEGGAGYLGDPARAGGDVLQGGPAAGEQGKAAFAGGAQPAQQQVAGALVLIQFP